jgi:hypothetical protein
MATLFGRTVTVRRRTGSYVKGVWTEGATSSFTIRGTAQPMSSREIESLNVGRKDTGKIKIYSDTQLVVSEEGATNAGDFIAFGGKEWEIIAELTNQNALINHYKYIAEYRQDI